MAAVLERSVRDLTVSERHVVAGAVNWFTLEWVELPEEPDFLSYQNIAETLRLSASYKARIKKMVLATYGI